MSSSGNTRCHRDRISELPDAVLCFILSFLTTTSVVKTSVLSKRWRYIWMKVPVLDFSGMPCYPLSLKQKISFRSFVDKVLLHNDESYVHRFCLAFHDPDVIYVKSWLNAAAKREIRELDIDIDLFYNSEMLISLPPRLISSEKIVVLKLHGNIIISSLMFSHLPSIETIVLEDLKFPDDGSIKSLLSNCPVVKELQIVGCDGFPNVLYVESLTLKSLTFMQEFEGLGSARLVIKTPNLKYLSLRSSTSQFDIGDMFSLIKADLNVVIDDDDFGYQVQRLLKLVSGVKTLVSIDEKKLPLFQNLTHLELEANKVMCELLKCAPKLKSLDIMNFNYGLPFDPELAPKHLPCLESVEVVQFNGEDEDISVVAYFLKAASDLTEIKLNMSLYNHVNEREIFKKLLSLPRSSVVCQVNIV